MADKLKLARGLSLAPEQMLQRFAILAMSGAGKSNVAAVMAEQMYGQVPWVVIDPKGDWWGLRSSQTGKSAGLDVPIFGGLHADIPLYEDGGQVMAEAVASELTHSILDVSEFDSKAAMLRFLTAFAERLYRVNKRPLMVILEEADEFIPQRTNSPEEAKSVGVWSRIVKRGRTRAIFTTLIAQRIAELAKAVLNQSDTVIALRATAKLDRDAVKGWIEYADASPEILTSLPKLDDGIGWIASPQKLKLTKRIHFDRRHTFDSGATPSLDGSREAVKLASIDLGAIEGRMKETIERAKAEDPKELRKQIAALQKQLRERPEHEPAEVPEPVEVPVPVLDEEIMAELHVAVDELGAQVGPLAALGEKVERASTAASEQIDRAEKLVAGHAREGHARQQGRPAAGTPSAPRRSPRSASPSPPPPLAPRGGGDDIKVSGSQQRILDALASLATIGVHEAHKTQLALFANASPKSSTYANNLGALRSAGLLDYPRGGFVAITSEGSERADAASAPSTTAELQDYVRSLVGASKARLLEHLIIAYPDALSKDDLAEMAGASATSSTFANNLGSLRSLGLIDYPRPGEVAALPVLFLEGR